ncbi:MAG: hypothetical protein AAF570_24515, partial [Bacteroidota bacterium]
MLILCLCFQATQAQDPGRAFGGTDTDQFQSLCVLPNGNYALLGRTRSKGAGSSDLYLLIVNRQGIVLNSRTIGNVRQDRGMWVEPTADGKLLVTGYEYAVAPSTFGRHNTLFYRFDADLNTEIESVFDGGGGRDIGFCVREAHGSGYIIFGYSRSFGNLGDFHVIKVDAAGNREWERAFATAKVDFGHELRLTSDGGYVLFGAAGGFFVPSEVEHQTEEGDMMLLKMDGQGNEEWRRFYGGAAHELGRAIHPAPNGGWYLWGSTMSQGAGSWDMQLIRVNAAGDSLWSQTYGGADFEYGTSLDVDAEGNLYLFGTTNSLGTTGSPDLYLIKADSGGNEIWSMTIGGTESDYGHCVRVLPDGGCILGGDTRSFGMGGMDGYLVRVTSDGQIDLYGNQVGSGGTGILFPNPVTDISVMDPTLAGVEMAYEWRVYDTKGKLI